MKTDKIKYWYLQQGITVHIKLFFICIISGIAWGYINNILQDTIQLIGVCIIMFFDLEIVRLILRWYNKRNKKYVKQLLESNNIKRVVWINLAELLLFYVLLTATNTFGVILWVTILHLVKGFGFPDIAQIVFESQMIVQVIKATAIALILTVPVFLFLKWVEAVKNEFKFKEQNLIFQNETLKNQINPHFLFNSLNTLSSLVNTEAEMAGQFIAKLSVIYRYILENSSKLKVPLKEEINFIRDYYYLHQIRSEGKIKLKIDIRREEYEYNIIPISLQLLIENAIKHNMATQSNPLIINIYSEEQKIVIKNNIQKMATQVVSTKIGLKNLNERVKLVTGKEIIVTKEEGNFLVKVPLMI